MLHSLSGIACKERADFSRGLLDEGLVFCSLCFILFLFFKFRIEMLAVTNHNLPSLNSCFSLSDKCSGSSHFVTTL